MSNIPNLRPQILDSSSDAVSGAEWNFYETGTTTPKTIYTDRARTSAASNPVVADSRGEIARTFMTPGEAYTVTITAASGGATIYSEDGVYATEATDSATALRIDQGFSSPLDHGAVGDGAADEATEVQAAIDAATGVVDLLGKTFRCDSALTLKSGLTIRNGTFDFSNATSNEYLVALGTVGNRFTLTANALAGASLVALDVVTNLAAGDLLLTYSDALWSGANTIGEIHVVDSIATLDVTLVGVLESTHNTADNAFANEITPKTDIKLEDLTINCSTSASGTGDVIHMSFCRGVVIRNVKVNSFKAAAITLSNCVDVEVDGCTLDEDGGSGIGVAVEEASRNIFIGSNVLRRIATGVNVGGIGDGTNPDGVSRWIDIVSNMMTGVFTGISAGGQTQYGNIRGNDLYGGSGATFLNGIGINGNDWNVESNRLTLFNASGIAMAPISVNVASGAMRVVNNTLNGCGDAAATDNQILFQPAHASHETKSVIIEGNKVYQGTGHGITVNATSVASTIGDISVSGNAVVVDAAADVGIRVLLDGATITHGTRVDGNLVGATGSGASDCILVDEADNLSVSGNVLNVSGGTGVCIRVSGVSVGVTINNNTLDYSVALANGGLVINETNASGISRVNVSGNTLNGTLSTGRGMDFDGYINGLTVVGNNIVHGTTEAAIEIRGDAAAAVVDVVIDGNSISGGDDCIAVANGSNITLGTSNIFKGFTNLSVNSPTGLAGGLRVIRQTVAFGDFSDNGDATGTLVLSDDIPDGAVFSRLVIQNLVGFTGDTTAVMTVGDGTDVDRYHTVGTLNVLTTDASGVNAGAPVGTLWHAAAISPTIIVTGGADFTSISAGSFVIELWFYQG